MRYVGKLYRPPSEAHSYILQATIGCSWNNCTYCDMYRDKPTFQLRPLAECLEDLTLAAQTHGPGVEKVFIADGDALVLPMDHWEPILLACQELFPRLRQVSCYATAGNVIEKSPEQLERLRELGLSLLYMGPESGDETTMRRIAKSPKPKGASGDWLYDSHAEAARKTHAAGLGLSAIFLLGAGGTERSAEHATGSARLATDMDPEYLAALTLTVVPGTPLALREAKARFELPAVEGLLGELRTFVDLARPSDALFRTNHASNYLPLAGRLPRDRARIVATLDRALSGEIALRPEWSRGL
jgi:radical SAM superfamily enzyme YgiQ (UPF0313 family)